jgi:hypothetical protein
MIRFCKWMFVVILFLGGKEVFAANTLQPLTDNSLEITAHRNFVIERQAPETSPSHGFALLILRYNETSNEKVNHFLPSKPILQRAISIELTDNSKLTYTSDNFSFPEKLLLYEVYLYSLPLRSPPAVC